MKVDGFKRRVAKLERDARAGQEEKLRICFQEADQTNEVGEYWVNITIDDTMNIDYTNFTLTVINVNDAPVIITNDIETANEDEYYEVDYEAIDVDTPQKDLIWTMIGNASWLEFEPTTAVLSGTPKNDDVGECWVNISVEDHEYIDYSNFHRIYSYKSCLN